MSVVLAVLLLVTDTQRVPATFVCSRRLRRSSEYLARLSKASSDSLAINRKDS
jgi:hypothetical protein